MKSKSGNRAADRVKRDLATNSRRGTTTHRPLHPVGGDRQHDIHHDVGRDVRWDQFLADATAMFGACDDPTVQHDLREAFDAGVVGPEMLRALRTLRADGLDPDTVPGDLCELAEDAVELNGKMLDALVARGRVLLEADRAIHHDAARAILEFRDALDWVSECPDAVKALVDDIDREPRFASLAAWPRLACVVAKYGPEALDPYPAHSASLIARARVELRDRPAVVPQRVYELLGLEEEDLNDTFSAVHVARASRVAIDTVAAHVGDLLFVAGQTDRGSRAAAPATELADGATDTSEGGTATP